MEQLTYPMSYGRNPTVTPKEWRRFAHTPPVEAGNPRNKVLEDPDGGIPPYVYNPREVWRPTWKRKVDQVYFVDHPEGIGLSNTLVTIGGVEALTDKRCSVFGGPFDGKHPASTETWAHLWRSRCSTKWGRLDNNMCSICNPICASTPSSWSPWPRMCKRGAGPCCRCIDCHWRWLGIQEQVDAPPVVGRCPNAVRSRRYQASMETTLSRAGIFDQNTRNLEFARTNLCWTIPSHLPLRTKKVEFQIL